MNPNRIRQLSLADHRDARQAQTPTATADVVGVELDMSVADAAAATKVDSLKFGIHNQTTQLEGFEQSFVTSISAFRAPAAD